MTVGGRRSLGSMMMMSPSVCVQNVHVLALMCLFDTKNKEPTLTAGEEYIEYCKTRTAIEKRLS